MFAAVGNHVEQLRRIQIGSLHLDPDLPEGESREMTDEEMQLVFIDE
jgi:16S rRNA pseudouridine516 synthase